MNIAQLKRLPSVAATPETMRTTSGQDKTLATESVRWYRKRPIQIAAAVAVLLIGTLTWLLHEWSGMKRTVSAERIRVATVSQGHFIRDAAAQGTIIAAVNPTLFSTAPGTISYVVRAGDTVKKGQPLATLDSPALRNEYDPRTRNPRQPGRRPRPPGNRNPPPDSAESPAGRPCESRDHRRRPREESRPVRMG